MFDIEEKIRILNALKEKIKDLGESLWHKYIRKGVKRTRKSNS